MTLENNFFRLSPPKKKKHDFAFATKQNRCMADGTGDQDEGGGQNEEEQEEEEEEEEDYEREQKKERKMSEEKSAMNDLVSCGKNPEQTIQIGINFKLIHLICRSVSRLFVCSQLHLAQSPFVTRYSYYSYQIFN